MRRSGFLVLENDQLGIIHRTDIQYPGHLNYTKVVIACFLLLIPGSGLLGRARVFLGVEFLLEIIFFP